MATAQHNVPLIDILPAHLTDAQARAALRSSRKFRPYHGRWVFTRGEARRAETYLSRVSASRH